MVMKQNGKREVSSLLSPQSYSRFSAMLSVLLSDCASKSTKVWSLFLIYAVRACLDQFMAMLAMCATEKARVSSCFALPVVTRPLVVWDPVWLNSLMTLTGWKERVPPTCPASAPSPVHQPEVSGNTPGGHKKKIQTWLNCWSHPDPWQKWSVWWPQSPHPQAPPQSKNWAQKQEAHPHPPRWCGQWWCLGKDPGSGSASPGGSWHLRLSRCSFSCSQSLKANEKNCIYD